MSIKETLQQRGARYGEFSEVAETTYQLQEALKRSQPSSMTSSQIIALDMICNKMARIVNGDPSYIDNWHDIAGYATLVEQELSITNRDKEQSQ
ncbi:hypothetical protein AVENLUH5627_02663 [Acinetobacter venetianus]|uniref:DUF6378 domain-containing protein n=1 Tax=Acinetobacter venetianus TaxID=52133 RepID=A0A150HLB8_9GAMM|nr:DUF6378 domain-containing protein [Acinetobacter venetianus]KXZ65933.1 hypothetical protein AVENLUH5627_02663 [Acinetobacter venetianus]